MIRAVLSISLGASLGAVLRWVMGNIFNAMFPTIPLGTWFANMLGGYLIGLAITFFSAQPGLSPEWRLFIITGFLGGLTTFSTFSAEVTSLLQGGRVAWAVVAIVVHVGGALLMTVLGMLTVNLFRTL